MKIIPIRTPNYWDQACQELSIKDKTLAKLILKHKKIKIKSHGDPFTTLTRSIIGQQISVKAASTIWEKLHLCSTKINKNGANIQLVNPKDILQNFNSLEKVGLSSQKKKYIYDLAKFFFENKNFSSKLLTMNDLEITKTLLSFSGVGVWTVNMFMIFCLMRPDVFPDQDLGLINAIAKTYKRENEENKIINISKFAEKWKPWRTVATWYLWCSIDPEPIYY